MAAETNKSNADLLAAFDAQLAYTLSGNAAKEGSQAIALGRAAGLAQLMGMGGTAYLLNKDLEKLCGGKIQESMPNLGQLHTGYLKNPAAFAEFAAKENFPATAGLGFSNAAGSYAYALDYLSRGEKALAGGEAQWIAAWGAKALRAAGFEPQAKVFDNLWAAKTAQSSAQPEKTAVNSK